MPNDGEAERARGGGFFCGRCLDEDGKGARRHCAGVGGRSGGEGVERGGKGGMGVTAGHFEGDENINTSAIIIPSIEILGPITRSRAQQLNH
jgi:hypothetical protein